MSEEPWHYISSLKMKETLKVVKCWQLCPGKLWSLHSQETKNLTGCNPGQPPLAEPTWKGTWARRPHEVPSNLSNSLIISILENIWVWFGLVCLFCGRKVPCLFIFDFSKIISGETHHKIYFLLWSSSCHGTDASFQSSMKTVNFLPCYLRVQ